MSRQTPHLGWNRRLKKYGGLAGIATLRASQFARLAATIKAAKEPKTEDPVAVLATHAIEWLEDNARRVLSYDTELALGWHDVDLVGRMNAAAKTLQSEPIQ